MNILQGKENIPIIVDFVFLISPLAWRPDYGGDGLTHGPFDKVSFFQGIGREGLGVRA